MIQYEQSSVLAAPVKTTESLPALIDRAAKALADAKDSAEVLEARDMARVAYDAAKSAGRLAKAKQAHDTVLSQVYRAQADALMIEARAKMRLAEEYDAAQERGEVGKSGTRTDLVPVENEVRPATAADIGLTRKEIHEARQVRDAEKAEPGIAQRAINAMLERGEEPTKAKLNREIFNKPKPKPERVMDPTALWLWGRMNDFERDGVLTKDPSHLMSEMTDPMRDDVKRISPLVRTFLEQLENAA